MIEEQQLLFAHEWCEVANGEQMLTLDEAIGVMAKVPSPVGFHGEFRADLEVRRIRFHMRFLHLRSGKVHVHDVVIMSAQRCFFTSCRWRRRR